MERETLQLIQTVLTVLAGCVSLWFVLYLLDLCYLLAMSGSSLVLVHRLEL